MGRESEAGMRASCRGAPSPSPTSRDSSARRSISVASSCSCRSSSTGRSRRVSILPRGLPAAATGRGSHTNQEGLLKPTAKRD